MIEKIRESLILILFGQHPFNTKGYLLSRFEFAQSLSAGPSGVDEMKKEKSSRRKFSSDLIPFQKGFWVHYNTIQYPGCDKSFFGKEDAAFKRRTELHGTDERPAQHH